MPVPKKKRSKSRILSRRSHWALEAPNLITCPNPKCEEPMLPHMVCPSCGEYKGRNYFKEVKEKEEGAK
jgi:large subunit ribosomal protein L32